MSKKSNCRCGEKAEEKKESSCCCGGEKHEGKDSCCCSDGKSDCCCGGEQNGCCDPDACTDDPNTGRKEVVIVDYLYLDLSVCDRCQGTDERVAKAVELVRPIMDMAGYNIVMNKEIGRAHV